MKIAAKIDQILLSPSVASHRSELNRLAEVFSGSALADIESVFNETLAGSSGDAYRVALAWIDKRPYVSQEGQDKRVELGDLAVIFYNDVRMARDPIDRSWVGAL